MPRGGARNGKPGASYSNRSDLNQPVRTTQNQPYGQAGQQQAAQRAIPLPQTSGVMPQPAPLDAPTARPQEPLTAGIPSGPGPGPEALGLPIGDQAGDDEMQAALAALYRIRPNSDLARLIGRIR